MASQRLQAPRIEQYDGFKVLANDSLHLSKLLFGSKDSGHWHNKALSDEQRMLHIAVKLDSHHYQKRSCGADS